MRQAPLLPKDASSSELHELGAGRVIPKSERATPPMPHGARRPPPMRQVRKGWFTMEENELASHARPGEVVLVGQPSATAGLSRRVASIALTMACNVALLVVTMLIALWVLRLRGWMVIVVCP